MLLDLTYDFAWDGVYDNIDDIHLTHRDLEGWYDNEPFQDLDVLMLFNPAFDGIEDSDLGRRMRVVNLHPREWFTPFWVPDVP